MSESSTTWTDAAADLFLPSTEEEAYTQAELEEVLNQESPSEPAFTPVFTGDVDDLKFPIGDESESVFTSVFTDDPDDFKLPTGDESEPVLTPVFTDDLNDFKFLIGDESNSQPHSTDASTVSTPDLLGYNFDPQTSSYSQTAPGTPQPYPIEHRPTRPADRQPIFHHRSLPFHTQGNFTFVIHSQTPQGFDRRRSLSHGDIDRIAATPPHPTFLRLQDLQSPWPQSPTPEDNQKRYKPNRHSRSISQGARPSRRFPRTTVPYSMPGSPLVGTPVGTPPLEQLHRTRSRKRIRSLHPSHYGSMLYDDNVHLTRMTHPTELQHSRRIIEIGAMAVRKHVAIDPQLEKQQGASIHDRIMKTLQHLEHLLEHDGLRTQDAMKGCELIRSACRTNKSAETAEGAARLEESVHHVHADMPSRMMKTADSEVLQEYLDGDEFMSLLVKEDHELHDE